MSPPLVGLLYLPVLIWVGTGIGLLVAYRRSAPPVVLRLAATFLALWALLATTTLAWVLANGGWRAVLSLIHSPLVMFDSRYLGLWIAGALGALLVFSLAFVVNQAVGRGFLHLLGPTPLPWPRDLPRPSPSVTLLSSPSVRAEAFSFTLVERGGISGKGWHRREVILLSRGLLDRLAPDEVEAAIAHELGHIEGLDGRYLTFLRTLSRMMRWDPMLAYLASSITRREEYRADLQASRMTGNPMALARALFKVSTLDGPPMAMAGAMGFLGAGGERGRRDSIERIRR
ncbi:MAG: M48 family metalloprotease, partial [Thermoplasmata archaeon]|nr:M48 family metalloprotease [Thermoplasmata archaeon]